MKILLVTQYFWPEPFLINDLVNCLIAEGHSVEVFTGKPNYPDGKIYKGYRTQGFCSDYFNTTLIYRVPLISRGKNIFQLLLNYLSFVVSGIYYAKPITKNNYDIIFSLALSPITSVLPAIYLKRHLKIPLVIWIQDLWPESVKATGYIKNNFVLKRIGNLVRFIYGKADKLLVQSQHFIQPVSQYTCPKKIIYYPNSYLDQHGNTSQKLSSSLRDLFANFQCFIFAGNLGIAQSIETIINAAQKIGHLPNCKILLIGSGSQSDKIVQMIKNRKLTNVEYLGRFQPILMPTVFSLASGLIVSLVKNDLLSTTIPSKVQAYLCAGKPIIGALDGEGGRIINEAGAGLVGPAEDADMLAKNIEKIYFMEADKKEHLGQAGREYFLQHFEMKAQCKKLIDIFKKASESEQ